MKRRREEGKDNAAVVGLVSSQYNTLTNKPFSSNCCYYRSDVCLGSDDAFWRRTFHTSRLISGCTFRGKEMFDGVKFAVAKETQKGRGVDRLRKGRGRWHRPAQTHPDRQKDTAILRTH
uniref:Uncharacterized protein n=1 Tax=Setaria digitata TaxID=48799 RepID=A0A915PRC9_9BILA